MCSRAGEISTLSCEPEADTGIKSIVNEACSLTLRLASWPIEPASGWHHWISGWNLHLVSAVQLDELLSSCIDPWEKGRELFRLTHLARAFITYRFAGLLGQVLTYRLDVTPLKESGKRRGDIQLAALRQTCQVC